MKWMQETTEWEDGSASNHLYLLEGDKCFAYVAQGTNQHKVFKSPIVFDLRGRKFQFVKEFKPTKPNPALVKVQGSKGEVYEVNTEENTCTCPGFKYRGACKHVAETQH